MVFLSTPPSTSFPTGFQSKLNQCIFPLTLNLVLKFKFVSCVHSAIKSVHYADFEENKNLCVSGLVTNSHSSLHDTRVIVLLVLIGVYFLRGPGVIII